MVSVAVKFGRASFWADDNCELAEVENDLAVSFSDAEAMFAQFGKRVVIAYGFLFDNFVLQRVGITRHGA